MGKRRQFEAREYGRIRHEIEFRQILALQMERERLIQVRRKFIKGPALRHDRRSKHSATYCRSPLEIRTWMILFMALSV